MPNPCKTVQIKNYQTYIRSFSQKGVDLGCLQD